MTLDLTHKWEIQQVDINNAFLTSDLHKEVYMHQPSHFTNSDPTLVYKLKKALYGLKQAPRAWYEKLHQDLFLFGFTYRKCDHSLFIYSHKGVTLYALVHVDNILITGSSLILIHDLVNKLHDKF